LLGGYAVVVTRFDHDGWEMSRLGWLSAAPKDGQPFNVFLADFLGVPEDEAQQIADESVKSWQHRVTINRDAKE
jgi:hypothetical protein